MSLQVLRHKCGQRTCDCFCICLALGLSLNCAEDQDDGGTVRNPDSRWWSCRWRCQGARCCWARRQSPTDTSWEGQQVGRLQPTTAQNSHLLCIVLQHTAQNSYLAGYPLDQKEKKKLNLIRTNCSLSPPYICLHSTLFISFPLPQVYSLPFLSLTSPLSPFDFIVICP